MARQGGDASKTKVRRRSAGAESTAGAAGARKKTKKRRVPADKVQEDDSDITSGDEGAALPGGRDVVGDNPGMFLKDFVDELPSVGHKLSKSAARGKKKIVATKRADSSDDGDMTGDEGEQGDRLLGAIGRLGTADQEDDRGAPVRTQTGKESEFNVGAVSEEISIDDIVAPLADMSGFNDVRRQLQGITKKDPIPEQASDVKRTRAERAEQYEFASKDVQKWLPQVTRMKKADQVVLGEDAPEQQRTTSSLIGSFKPMDDFEKELEEATLAAGADQESLKGAKALADNPRIRDENSRQHMSKLKALMLREQAASKRVKKIKSKAYHRIHRNSERREREVLLERLEHENPELASALKEEYEKKRVQLRMLRQRNARKKWAQTMQRFGKTDDNVKKEITKQAANARDEEKSLRRAIKGDDPNQSSDEDAIDLSGGESGDEVVGKRAASRKTVAKAKELTMQEIKELQKGDSDLPTTGILGLSFMRDAIKRKREEAAKQAQGVLNELEALGDGLKEDQDSDDDSEEEQATPGKAPRQKEKETVKVREFTEEQLAEARKQVAAMLDNDDVAKECTVAGALTVHSVPAQATHDKTAKVAGADDLKNGGSTAIVGGSASSAPSHGFDGAAKKKKKNKSTVSSSIAAATANPWIDAPAGDDNQNGGSDAIGEGNARGPSAKKKKKAETIKKADPAWVGEGELEGAPEDILNILSADTEAAREQRDLVRTAFIQGTQEEDFAEEQEEKARLKAEKEAEKTDKLPGWGGWTGTGITPKKPKPSKPIVKPKSSEPRPTKVTFADEKGDPAPKYFIDQVPFPFQNKEQYNQQLRMPSGPEWNTMAMHQKRVKPKIFTKVGAVVAPLAYVKHLEPEQRDRAIETWSAGKQPKRLKSRM